MDPSRRRIARASAAAALLLPWAGAAARPGPAGSARPRRDLASPAGAADLQALETAVARLRALPPQDPRSWIAQVLRHREQCPHANWWLLPWHRAFVHYFEASCADVLGDPGYRIPYWDWSRQRRIPPAFVRMDSPLFHGDRLPRPVDRLPDDLVGPALLQQLVASPVRALVYGGATTSDRQQETAIAGKLEGAPHNAVHQFVGGAMATMLSPLDPLFWPHHANVDRLWASWLRLHDHAVPDDPRWGRRPMEEFHDPATGATVSPTAAETALSPAFDVAYDRYELPLRRTRVAAPAPRRDGARLDLAAAADLHRVVASGDVDGRARPRLRLRFAASALLDDAATVARDPARGAVLLVLEGLQSQGASAMRLEAGSDAVEAAATDDGKAFATLAFFGAGTDAMAGMADRAHAGHDTHGAHARHGDTAMLVDATAALATLRPGQPLRIALTATGIGDRPAAAGAAIALHRASLVVLD